MRVLMLTEEGFEDSELSVPAQKLKAAGFDVKVACLSKREISGKHGLRITPELGVDEVDPSMFDALVIPGGKAPERLRKNERVLSIVRNFHRSGKTIAAICHGPQVLVSAGILRDRVATSYWSVRREIEGCGGRFVDRSVVVDGNIITSRVPQDLDDFCRELINALRGK